MVPHEGGAPGNLQPSGPIVVAIRKAFFTHQRFPDWPAKRHEYAFYGVPWLTQDVHEELIAADEGELDRVYSSVIPGTLPRVDGSPYWINKMPDLHGVRYRRILDGTGTHLNREPADIGRYAALVMYASSWSFGHHRLLPKGIPTPIYHFEDDTLFALGMYLYSLDPPEIRCGID